MKAVAKRLTTKYGDSIVLVEFVNGGYNPATGENSTTETLYPLPASITSFVAGQYPSDSVQIDDLFALIETDLVPNRTWQVDYNKERLRVIRVQKVNAQDTTIIYKLQLRK